MRGKSSRNVSRKILNGLSDQQVVEGIAVQIVGLARAESMVPYHFFIIWMLALLSTATNFAALLALVQDFKRDWVLRWVRQFFMFVNLALSVVFGIFVLEANTESLSPTLPIACVWKEHDKSEKGRSSTPLSVAATIAVYRGELHYLRAKYMVPTHERPEMGQVGSSGVFTGADSHGYRSCSAGYCYFTGVWHPVSQSV